MDKYKSSPNQLPTLQGSVSPYKIGLHFLTPLKVFNLCIGIWFLMMNY